MNLIELRNRLKLQTILYRCDVYRQIRRSKRQRIRQREPESAEREEAATRYAIVSQNDDTISNRCMASRENVITGSRNHSQHSFSILFTITTTTTTTAASAAMTNFSQALYCIYLYWPGHFLRRVCRKHRAEKQKIPIESEKRGAKKEHQKMHEHLYLIFHAA